MTDSSDDYEWELEKEEVVSAEFVLENFTFHSQLADQMSLEPHGCWAVALCASVCQMLYGALMKGGTMQR